MLVIPLYGQLKLVVVMRSKSMNYPPPFQNNCKNALKNERIQLILQC